MLRRFSVLLFMAATLLAIPALWIWSELATPFYSASEPEIFVDIPKGATSRLIAGLMVDAGVLNSRIPFLLYVRWTGNGRLMQAGEYRFFEPATPARVVERLVHGDVFYLSITIPEGLTASETVELIARNKLGDLEEMERALHRTEWIQDLSPRALNLEGYLFPDTYRFSRKVTSEEIVRTMLDQFRNRYRGLLADHPLPEGWTADRIVRLASIVEKEVKSQEERVLVAAVLKNRLQKGMPLACDPTIIYALKLAGRFDGNIRKTDLSIASPYNTYVHTGLPPAPIANPGLGSLSAALAPTNSDYLYFVSRNNGTHQFSKDLKSHQAAVNRFQKRAAR